MSVKNATEAKAAVSPRKSIGTAGNKLTQSFLR